MALEEPANDARKWSVTHGGVQPIADLHQGEIRLLLDPPKDQRAMAVDPV